MIRKTALVFSAILFLLLIGGTVNFLAKGKFLFGDKVQETEETVASLSAVKKEENVLFSPTPEPSVQGTTRSSVYRELSAKMVGDVGFDAVILPVFASVDGKEFKALLVKESSERRIKSFEIQIPKDWVFKSGGEIKQDEVVGSGKANVFVGDNLREVPVRIVNDHKLGGHVAHWKFYFGSLKSPLAEVLDGYVDGEEKGGFKISLSRGFMHAGRPQAKVAFSIFSSGDGGSAVFTGSGSIEDKVKATVIFFDGSSVEIEN